MVGCPHCTRIRRFLACLVLSSLGPCSLILIMNKSFEIRKASLPIEYNMLDNKRKNKKKKKEGSKNVLGRALSSSPLVHKLKPNSSRSRLVLWLMVSKSSYFGHLDAFPILSYEGPLRKKPRLERSARGEGQRVNEISESMRPRSPDQFQPLVINIFAWKEWSSWSSPLT